MFAGPCDDWREASRSYFVALDDALSATQSDRANMIARSTSHLARGFTISWMLRLAADLGLDYMVDSQTCSDVVFGGVEIPNVGGSVSVMHLLSLVVDDRLATAISPAWEAEDGAVFPLVSYAEARQAAIEQIIVPLMEVEAEYGLPQRQRPV